MSKHENNLIVDQLKDHWKDNYCDLHDTDLVNKVCQCCERYIESGYAYDCDDHGPFNHSCVKCDNSEFNGED